jgi:hypothetical protein
MMPCIIGALLATVAGGRAAAQEPLALTIDNMHEKSVVHSGFVVGTASEATGAVRVQVSLDGGAFLDATGLASWKFELPFGTATWRDGSAHTVAARALDADGNVVAGSATISVRKGDNRDVDGDGFEEVVVGDPGFDHDRGRIYVFYSQGNGGIPSTADANNPDDTNVKIIEGLEGAGPQRFGAAIAMGDVNGDGHADVVVGAPAHAYDPSQPNTGRIYVFYPAADENATTRGGWDIAANSADGTPTGILGDYSGAMLAFGTSVATGDLNGDGIADVIAGAPGSDATPDIEVGTVYMFFAHHDDEIQGLKPPTVFGADNKIQSDSRTSRFGVTVAAGDVNGDGFADVAVGETRIALPGVDDPSLRERGQVYVFHAATDGTGIAAASPTEADTKIAGEDGIGPTAFGASLAMADLNGDGFDDLVAGAPELSDFRTGDNGHKRGKVYAHYAKSDGTGIGSDLINDGVRGDTSHRKAVGGQQGTGSDQLFAFSVAVGDVNGDGTQDVIVGAPASLNGAGRVYTLLSIAGVGINPAINVPSKADTIIAGTGALELGRAVAAADAAVGDGILDVVAGVVSSPGLEGQVLMFTGSSDLHPGRGVSGNLPEVSLTEASVTLTGAAGDDGALGGFGSTIQ